MPIVSIEHVSNKSFDYVITGKPMLQLLLKCKYLPLHQVVAYVLPFWT